MRSTLAATHSHQIIHRPPPHRSLCLAISIPLPTKENPNVTINYYANELRAICYKFQLSWEPGRSKMVCDHGRPGMSLGSCYTSGRRSIGICVQPRCCPRAEVSWRPDGFPRFNSRGSWRYVQLWWNMYHYIYAYILYTNISTFFVNWWRTLCFPQSITHLGNSSSVWCFMAIYRQTINSLNVI